MVHTCGPLTFNIRKSCTLPIECMYVRDSCDSYSERLSLPQGRINHFIYVIETFCASCEVETILIILFTCKLSRCVLDGQGIEFGWGKNFRTRSSRPWGLPSLLNNWYHLCFPGVKQPWRDFDHPPQFCAEVKEELELYRSFFCGHSLLVLGVTLRLPLPLPLHPE